MEIKKPIINETKTPFSNLNMLPKSEKTLNNKNN